MLIKTHYNLIRPLPEHPTMFDPIIGRPPRNKAITDDGLVDSNFVLKFEIGQFSGTNVYAITNINESGQKERIMLARYYRTEIKASDALNQLLNALERGDNYFEMPGDPPLDDYPNSKVKVNKIRELVKNNSFNFTQPTRKVIAIEQGDYCEDCTCERFRRASEGYGEGDNRVPGIAEGFQFYNLTDRQLIAQNDEEAEWFLKHIVDCMKEIDRLSQKLNKTKKVIPEEPANKLYAKLEAIKKIRVYEVGIEYNQAEIKNYQDALIPYLLYLYENTHTTQFTFPSGEISINFIDELPSFSLKYD